MEKKEKNISFGKAGNGVGSKINLSKLLVEVKHIPNDAQSFDLPKYKYNVLHKYECDAKTPLLFAIFWQKG